MIGLVYIQDISDCPFLEKYERVLKECNIEYKIIFWNRKSNDKNIVKRFDNCVEYCDYQDVNKSKIKKLEGFFRFRHFLTSELKTCDKIIYLTTLSAMIVFDKILAGKQEYIFDYRDPSYESDFVFYKILEAIINKSYFTCISSEKFKKILPKNNYIVCHNFRYDDYEKGLNKAKTHKAGEKIKVVYFGALREYDHIINQIKLFSSDDRFELYFHGDGSCYLDVKKYVDENEFKNIYITGHYRNEDKHEFVINADIINNHYPINNNYEMCISNKYYDSLIYRKMLLSNSFENSFDGKEICSPLKNKNDLDFLYNVYNDHDQSKLDTICENELKEVLFEDSLYINKIKNFIGV